VIEYKKITPLLLLFVVLLVVIVGALFAANYVEVLPPLNSLFQNWVTSVW
jgi:hypothetical protein